MTVLAQPIVVKSVAAICPGGRTQRTRKTKPRRSSDRDQRARPLHYPADQGGDGGAVLLEDGADRVEPLRRHAQQQAAAGLGVGEEGAEGVVGVGPVGAFVRALAVGAAAAGDAVLADEVEDLG